MSRITQLRTIASSAAVALLALGVTAGPANADREVVKDAAKDVLTSTYTETSGETVAIDPADTSNDITRIVVKHGNRRIRIVAHVRDLRAASEPILTSIVKTNETAYAVMLMRTPLWGSMLDITDVQSEDDSVPCSGARQAISAKRDRFLISVPRRCLGNPRWIRASVRVGSFDIIEGETEDDFTISSRDDDARVAGKVPPIYGPGSGKSFGPRLYRG